MTKRQTTPLPACHTPGPWHYYSNEDGKPICNIGNFAIAYMDAYTPDEDDGGEWERETDANGNLVAAAPEMLAALQAASDWIDAQIGVPRTDIQATIQAAIAKATSQILERRPA
jgi:hypothetical protein